MGPAGPGPWVHSRGPDAAAPAALRSPAAPSRRGGGRSDGCAAESHRRCRRGDRGPPRDHGRGARRCGCRWWPPGACQSRPPAAGATARRSASPPGQRCRGPPPGKPRRSPPGAAAARSVPPGAAAGAVLLQTTPPQSRSVPDRQPAGPGVWRGGACAGAAGPPPPDRPHPPAAGSRPPPAAPGSRRPPAGPGPDRGAPLLLPHRGWAWAPATAAGGRRRGSRSFRRGSGGWRDRRTPAGRRHTTETPPGWCGPGRKARPWQCCSGGRSGCS